MRALIAAFADATVRVLRVVMVALFANAMPLQIAEDVWDTVAAAEKAPRPIESLIRAERDFAALSVAKGMRTAFVANLADDAIIFRPGPINGAQSWRTRAEVPGVLDWAPEFVELSGAGDLGFSTGPWIFRSKPGEKPGAAGHFITVWRKDAAGNWKVALDCGGSHAIAGEWPREAKVSEGPAHSPPDSNAWKGRGFDVGGAVRKGHTTVGAGTGGVGVGLGSGGFGLGLGLGGYAVRSRTDYEFQRTAHERNAMMTADRTLAFHVRKSGWIKGYSEVAANDLRFQREEAEPTLGTDAATEARVGRPIDVTWDYRGNGVAKSWDLGYSYGVAIGRKKGAKPDTSAFVHLWRKDDAGKWRMVVDWEGPYPKR